jgi:hypothetical protein
MIRAILVVLIFVFALPSLAQKEDWKQLFNGKDLTGWKQLNGEAKFTVIDGEIVGTTVKSDVNSFLATEKVYGDFVLELEFKLGTTNSGIQVRSESKPGYQDGRVHGYQVELDPGVRSWTGGIYDEARRGWLYPLTYNPEGENAYIPGEWNNCKIECIGETIRVWINGRPISHIIDDVTKKGFIALQVHGVGRDEEVGKEMRWKNIRIRTGKVKPLPPEKIFIANLSEARRLQASGKGFNVVSKPTEKMVEVSFNSSLITSYMWPDSVMKPVLYPIRTIGGTRVTRDYPLVITKGERSDHPHHVGLFFAHQSVNGKDFWNMSPAIPLANRHRYGKILHTWISCAQALEDQALLITHARWVTNEGNHLLDETTTTKFTIRGKDVVIDRSTTLTAVADEVIFKDEKDALLAVRVARELELPVEGKDRFVNADGSITELIPNDNSVVTGTYRNSESEMGDAVWGKRANWVTLDGKKDGKDISIAIIDDPHNPEYPAYWHARGYGLFAVNPLGKKIFTDGKAEMNLKLVKGESAGFAYRIIVREGSHLTSSELNQYLVELR